MTTDGAFINDESASARFRRVSEQFGARVATVAPGEWSNPAPCAGWTALDVLHHLLEWVPAVLDPAGLAFAGGPAIDVDPLGAWTHFADVAQRALDDPAVAARAFNVGPLGERSVVQVIDMLVLGDVLVHTWDLARATGSDEHLDEAAVAAMLDGIEQMDDAMRASGHYGPKVMVAATADPQTKLLAFTGRDPASR